MTKPISLGPFDLGSEMVKLILLPDDTGGQFSFFEHGSIPEIRVGIANEWRTVLEVLFHEVFEFVLTRKELRFERTDKFYINHADYLFVLDHVQFADVCARAGMFMEMALPKVVAAYKKHGGVTRKGDGE